LWDVRSQLLYWVDIDVGVMVEMTRAGRRATCMRSMSVLVVYRSRYSVDMAPMFVTMDLARTDLADR